MSVKNSRPQPEAYAESVLKLLKGSISEDHDNKTWDNLITYEKSIRSYLGKIGLDLYLDKIDGYAFLRQTRDDENEGEEDVLNLPKLTVRRSLNRKETLLVVLLREALLDWEENHPEDPPILKRSSIHERLNPYFPETGNEVERIKELDRIIARVVDYGFIRDLRNDHFKIERIIKAKLPMEDLKIIKEKLESGGEDEPILSDSDRS